MVDSFFVAVIVTGFDGPVAAPPYRRDGLFAVIARYRRYLIWKQGRAMVSLIKPGANLIAVDGPGIETARLIRRDPA
jgi:hypothetical protein